MSQDSIVNPNEAVYADEHLSLDFVNQSVTLDGYKVQLTRKEYRLLAHMAQHAGEIVPRDALLTEVWGYGPDLKTRTIDVHVRRLRRKLGNYADRGIETIFGVGYRFQPRREGHPSNISDVDPALTTGD
jgi:two-component system phosphate regulon response regulator PhoB